ncbi:MAG TPA: DUF3467 domain-containing protein [Solirubrobacteraceae bacterium]|nr:DUF3467 domain-containing protein [Solirubrobacteraceae bacterium]
MPDTPERAEPTEVALIYANSVNASGTAYDIAIDFAYRARADDPAQPTARVVMSWEHAVSLVKVLNRLIGGYEQEIGPVRDIETIEDHLRRQTEEAQR